MSKTDDIEKAKNAFEAAAAALKAAAAEPDEAAPAAPVVEVVPAAPAPTVEPGLQAISDAVDASALEALRAKARQVHAPPPAETTLNKARPFGTVMPFEGVKRYFQDGQYFDYAGNLVKA